MSKIDDYADVLKTLPVWEAYLLENSGLPGPRGNLELAYAAAEVGEEDRFKQLIASDERQTGHVAGDEYLVVCGLVGLGKWLTPQRSDLLAVLRHYANDERWRLREAVAMAFQGWGKLDMAATLDVLQGWVQGTFLEQRAAAAALCEPVLLKNKTHVLRVLSILDEITASMLTVKERKNDNFQTLRQGLAYCWSVAAVAAPEEGKRLMERWINCDDADIRWLMKENLKKNRLVKMDAAWVEENLQKVQTVKPQK
ncbi:MAG: hypothetical protein LWX83_19860 [Anaerolineae bacterium]|nr:hypothetical protein [Anaerolineae bacterium]